MFYTEQMKNISARRALTASLTLRIGHWFEAHATGWGVIAVPLVLLLLLGAVLVRAWFA